MKSTELFFTPETLPIPVNRGKRYAVARDAADGKESGLGLPVIRCGKRLLIPRAAFERWLATCGQSVDRPVWEDSKHAEMMRGL